MKFLQVILVLGISVVTLIWERLILRPVVFVLGVIAPAVVLVQVIAARSIFPIVYLWNWMVLKPVSSSVVLVVPLLVIGWHGVTAWKLGELRRIADELGSVRQFAGNPLPNHAGNRVLAVQTMENGVGLYLCSVSTGTRRLLSAQEEEKYRAITLLGWSPDDKQFAYSQGRDIFLCDATSGDVLETLGLRGTNGVAMLTWLRPDLFVYAR